ncbi:MAG: hypothetical protein NC078_10515 [Ruminococcus sp.]|nr:hypothetical protein [Ruminococcus sp.]
MTDLENLKNICAQAAGGKLSPKDFYEKLKEIAQAQEEDSDLACLLEDALMDMEMDGSPAAARETAKGITEEIDGHF